MIIFSKISSIPSPVLPEHGTALSVSIPITSSICFFVLSKSDAGKSILFSTGIAIGYYLGKRRKCSDCDKKDYVINELKFPPYIRSANLWKYH